MLLQGGLLSAAVNSPRVCNSAVHAQYNSVANAVEKCVP